MRVRVSFSGSDRWQGATYRVRPGQTVDLPDGLARRYIAAGKATAVPERKVVAPAATAVAQPDETPSDAPDETPDGSAESDKAVPLGGGWWQLPDGTKRRGRP